MLIQNLFEKTEQAQYELLTYLLDKKDFVSLKETLEYLEISRSTLLKYIDDINLNFKHKKNLIEVVYRDDNLTLRVDRESSWEEVIEKFTKDSIKFKILSYLLHNAEFTIPNLALKLSISEATLNRHLSSLNKLLQEFKLSIRNGRIHGSELQIRYFYFQLLINTHSSASLKQMQNTDLGKRLADYLEKNYISNFNEKQHLDIIVCMYIFQLRLKIKNKNFISIDNLMIPFMEHKIYKRLKNELSYFSSDITEGDVMCLFAFLASKSLLSAPISEQILGYGGPLTEATTVGIQCIKTLPLKEYRLNEQAMYSLGQLMGHIYFFTGYLVRKHVITSDDKVSLYKNRVDKVFTYIMNDIYKQSDEYSVHQREVFDKKMLDIFSYLLERHSKILKVAVKLSGDEISNYLLMKKMRQELEKNRMIFLEWYEADKEYDYLIVDFIDKVSGNNVYCLKNRFEGQDIRALKIMLHKGND